MEGNKRKAGMRRLALTIATCCLICAGSVAQENHTSGLPDAPSASAQSQTEQQGGSAVENGVNLFLVAQKKSRVFPTMASNSEPLDSWEKFKLAVNNTLSLSAIGAVVIGAGFNQAIDTPEGYGQGGEGYGKRVGAGMARVASTNMFGTFVIASVMHEDPRFFVKKDLSFKQSVLYSAQRLVITRNDSGDRVISFSDLLGPLAAEGLANTYYPEGNQGIGDVFTRYVSDMGWKFAGNLLRQYWPTISKKRQKSPSTAGKSSSN